MNFETICEGITSGIIIAVILLMYDTLQEKQRKKRKAQEKVLEWYFSGSKTDTESEMRDKMYHYRKYADEELRRLISNHMRSFAQGGANEARCERQAIYEYLK